MTFKWGLIASHIENTQMEVEPMTLGWEASGLTPLPQVPKICYLEMWGKILQGSI